MNEETSAVPAKIAELSDAVLDVALATDPTDLQLRAQSYRPEGTKVLIVELNEWLVSQEPRRRTLYRCR